MAAVDAAHLDLQMRLAQAAILAGRLDRGGGFDRFAERLHGNARRRRDVLFARATSRPRLCRCSCANRFAVVSPHHLPTSLIAPLVD